MSLVLKMLRAFPNGRTTEEILVLTGASFFHDKRVAILAEIDELLADREIRRNRDGLWLVNGKISTNQWAEPNVISPTKPETTSFVLESSVAEFQVLEGQNTTEEEQISEASQPLEPKKLLQYWRASLRADPRGATTQVVDKHGLEWQLISGRGPVVFEGDETLKISISFESLSPTFQEALVRREGNENALAVGWPLSVGRKLGVPIVQPVGMLTAYWVRDGAKVRLSIEADDVLINPEWVSSAAKISGWNKEALTQLFVLDGGSGMRSEDFRTTLRNAIASQIRGSLTGENLISQLDPEATGVYNACGLFLPTESSFTVGAARDLDVISNWPTQRLADTALGAALQFPTESSDKKLYELDAVQLNREQLNAVRNGLQSQITVVTGPPGTGKSQAIVAMAASVLAGGGSVLVASKNHQALDAVEGRLGSLAPGVPFITRTLNPSKELDVDCTAVLAALLHQENQNHFDQIDEMAVLEMQELSDRRRKAIDLGLKFETIELQIAEILERIAFREARSSNGTKELSGLSARQSFWEKLLVFLFAAKKKVGSDVNIDVFRKGQSLPELRYTLEKLRMQKEELGNIENPIPLGDEIKQLVEKLLPKILAKRTSMAEDARTSLSQLYEDWDFSQNSKGLPPGEITRSLISFRPLWLASILGTPKRIPLEEGLFDLVIFDEASQCDIATAIPLFARAKRAVIVGDDKQLSFISSLGRAQDRNLMKAQGLPVGSMARFAQSRQSLFGFASRLPNAKRITLRQQYRSAGPIVNYINEAFYGGALSVAYDPSRLNLPKKIKPGIAWEHVPEPSIPQKGNVNLAEVKAITHHLKLLLQDQAYSGSVGVITPFRNQVMALETSINAAIPVPLREAADLRIGTVDGFQGQERDLILFSPCVGRRSPQSGLTFFQRDTRRLNVAVSRARAVAMIFGDLDFAKSGRSKALTRLAAIATEPRPKSGEGVFDSGWERRVFYALQEAGLDPQPQHEIAGRRLDFALFGKTGIKLDLEVDGRRWHQGPDGQRKSSDLWRDAQLKSMGWKVRRFWVDELAKDMEGCIDLVKQDLS